MSSENVDAARQAVAAYNRRDVDALMGLATPDVEWFPVMPRAVEGGGYRGRAGMERYFAEISDTWEQLRIVGDDFRELAGDRVLFLGRVEGRGIGSGVEVDAPVGLLYDFKDGKGWRCRGYVGHDEALNAAELDP